MTHFLVLVFVCSRIDCILMCHLHYVGLLLGRSSQLERVLRAAVRLLDLDHGPLAATSISQRISPY